MNSNTYNSAQMQELLTQMAKAKIDHSIDIDETVPDGQVRLAGNRYVSVNEFARMVRREIPRDTRK